MNIEDYLDSLPDDIESIDLDNGKLNYIPSLIRFKNLKMLCCCNNKLTSLPQLNENLEILFCENNKLTSLPQLNENLISLNCRCNELISLPQLNKKLETVWCSNNNLTSLPDLNENLEFISFINNPIYLIINDSFSIDKIKPQIQTLNNFRHLYYSLKFKTQFRKWLWVKVREPRIIKKYHPIYLIENLDEHTDLDEVLNEW